MFFTVGLYVSLAICILGTVYKVARWFRLGVTEQDRNIKAGARIKGVLGSVAGIFSGLNLPRVLKTLFLDVLLLRRSFKEDLYRWVMHMLIFWGFILLLFMHAFESFISEPYLPDYMSTLNPYLFLRDFFGLMVIAGILMAVYRRLKMPRPRLKTRSMDYAAIGIVIVIILSGILLKGSKIASESEFMRMVEDYSHIYYYDEEVEALKSYWVQNYGLISPEISPPFEESVLEEGAELNDMFCVTCHSQSQWAAVSYGSSKLTYPITSTSDGEHLVSFFWYLHVLACFAGLAWIPFGKMFHIFTSPLSLVVSSVSRETRNAGSSAVRRMMELDACTSCGACSERCSVGTAVESIPNSLILPSEKLRRLRLSAGGDKPCTAEQQDLAEALVVCTNCRKCTGVCPVGINLQDIWEACLDDMYRQGVVQPYALSQLSLNSILRARAEAGADTLPWLQDRKTAGEIFRSPERDEVLEVPGMLDKELVRSLELAYNYCVKCKTCTLACPVPEYFEDAGRELGLFPHQIVHATILGQNDLVSSSRMLWACVGCYQCQEHCPQEIRVTDVLYAHKQAALSGLKAGGK